MGVIAGKIYDFIFGEENSNKSDNNVKEKDKEKGSEESNNKDNKIDVTNDRRGE